MVNIIRWDPMREVINMRDAMERTFDDFFSRSPTSYQGYGVFDLDMYQTNDNVIVKASVPGVKAEDIQISIIGDILTIRGEVKEDEEIKEANYHIRERRYGSFSRSLALPTQVLSEKAAAEFENGILKLTLPKAEEVKLKTIMVKAK